MGKKAKTKHALNALSSQLARAFWDGMQHRGRGQDDRGPTNRSEWDCACGTRANFASRSKCRACGKPRPSGSSGSPQQTGGGGGGHGSGGGSDSDTKQAKGQSNSAGKATSTWASVVASHGHARNAGGNGSGGPARVGNGTGSAVGPQARADDGHGKHGGDDGQTKDNGDDADGESSVAAARNNLAKQERILKLLVDEGTPSDDELVQRATARVEAAKARLETARSSNPPPAYALLNAERKVTSAVKAEKRAKESVADAEKALGEARKAHMQAVVHREAMEGRVQELRSAVGRPPAEEEQRQRKVHTEAERLCTQLVALPSAKNAGNGELAWGQIEEQVKSLVQLLQSTMADKPNAKPPAAAAGAPVAAAVSNATAAGTAGKPTVAAPAPTDASGGIRSAEAAAAAAATPAAPALGPADGKPEPPPADANLPPPPPSDEPPHATGDTEMQLVDDGAASEDARGIPTTEEYERFMAREEEKKRRRLGLSAKEGTTTGAQTDKHDSDEL
jgi:hypothetical protein